MAISMDWLSSAGGTFREILDRRKQASDSGDAAADLMIVRRGMSPAYYFFCRLFAQENGLKVMPDRRAADRRRRQRPTASIDRRRLDRRKADNHFVRQDFLIVRHSRSTAGTEPRHS
jgi:hypothetical protein